MKLVFASVAVLSLAAPAWADKKLDDAIAKAEDQLAKNKPEEAVKTLQKAASQAPGSEGHVALCRLLARLGSDQLDEAAAACARAKDASATETGAVKAQTLAAVATFLLSVGPAKDALGLAQTAVQAQETPEALASLARAQVRGNDAQTGLKTADKAVAANAASALAHEARGDALSAMGLAADAAAAYRKAAELDPKLTRARAGLATALAAAGKGAEAAAEAKKASDGDPQSAEAFAALGLALLAENPKNWNDAIAQAQQGAFLNPKNPVIQVAVGRIFEGNANFEQAVSAFKKALEIDPGYSPARLALIRVQDLQGDRKGALAEATKLAQEMPTNGEAQFLVGRAHMRAGDHAAALPALEKAAALTPGNAEAHALHATAAFFTGKNDVAVAAYKKALDLKPDNLQWRTDYGLFLARNGNHEAGAAELKKVVSSPGYKDAAGYVNLGYVYRNMKPPKVADSIAAYKKALELDPKEEQAALGLGWAFMTSESYDESIAAYNKAVQIEPKLAGDAYVGIAWCQYFKKDMAQAKASATKAKDAGRPVTSLLEAIANYEAAVARGGADQEKAIEDAKRAQQAAAAVNAILENLSSKNPGTRSRALRDLVPAVSAGEAVRSLTYYLANDPDYTVRQTAATLLGGLGAAARSAIPYLRQCAGPCPEIGINAKKEEMEQDLLCQDTRRVCQAALSRLQ